MDDESFYPSFDQSVLWKISNRNNDMIVLYPTKIISLNDLKEQHDWLLENFSDDQYKVIGNVALERISIQFINENDATLFLMRWN